MLIALECAATWREILEVTCVIFDDLRSLVFHSALGVFPFLLLRVSCWPFWTLPFPPSCVLPPPSCLTASVLFPWCPHTVVLMLLFLQPHLGKPAAVVVAGSPGERPALAKTDPFMSLSPTPWL